MWLRVCNHNEYLLAYATLAIDKLPRFLSYHGQLLSDSCSCQPGIHSCVSRNSGAQGRTSIRIGLPTNAMILVTCHTISIFLIFNNRCGRCHMPSSVSKTIAGTHDDMIHIFSYRGNWFLLALFFKLMNPICIARSNCSVSLRIQGAHMNYIGSRLHDSANDG
jgi:hypothetical protein